ncbi:MAG TPA: nucleoside monophosphate kinase [Candidatus Paceibacterota bacterium]
MDFPIFKTRTGDGRFALEDPIERHKYFEHKAGPEIEKIKNYLQKGTFVGILLGRKNSGKGTYTKLFMEAVGADRVAHISIGDVVRSAHQELEDSSKKTELVDFLKKRYRGFLDVDQVVNVILGRDTKTLLPTEAILALVEREIQKVGRKAVFVDGFPRSLDQVSYSLYLRSIMGYRDDPDFLAFIDVPDAVIDERMKYRVICPKCHTPRNLKLLRTKKVGYDNKTGKFFLVCDDVTCGGAVMIPKEGDELGIEAIRGRIEADDKVMEALLGLNGVPKILLRNSVPASSAAQNVDDYEITPAYRYEESFGTVKVVEEPWTVKDHKGEDVYSLLPAAVAVSLIKQISKALNL